MNSLVPYLPFELIDLILSYDGRIRFRNGRFSNVILSNDPRYAIIEPVICKKMTILSKMILSKMEISDSSFYFEFEFDSLPRVGLCYDYHWSNPGKFEIYYFNFQNPKARKFQYRLYK
jgi:hypothetical protein